MHFALCAVQFCASYDKDHLLAALIELKHMEVIIVSELAIKHHALFRLAKGAHITFP